MFAGLWAYFYFLNLKGALFLLGFLPLFGLFIAVAPVIHDFTYRRICIGRNLYQVQTILSCSVKGLSSWNDADLVAVGVYDPNFPNPNIVIDFNSVGSNRSLGSSW